MTKTQDELNRMTKLYEALVIADNLMGRLVDAGMGGQANEMFNIMADITMEYDRLEGDDIVETHPFMNPQVSLLVLIKSLKNILLGCEAKASYSKQTHANAIGILNEIKRFADNAVDDVVLLLKSNRKED